jgi:phage-related tail fiber protein
MADIAISGLPAASSAAAADEFEVNQGGASRKLTLAQIAALLIPPGTPLPFAGATAPTGFLLCDGAAVSRTTYAALFTAISTVYGAGDGSTTFNLPDYRGAILMGAGQGTGLNNRTLGDVMVLGELDSIAGAIETITGSGTGNDARVVIANYIIKF